MDEFEVLFDKMIGRHEKLMNEEGYRWGALKTLYIGGGTPSLWGERGAEYLKTKFSSIGLSLMENGEFTLEVNPGTWAEDSIKAWQNFGINRFSLGIQALRQDYLKILDRVHDVEEVHKTLSFFNEIGASFSVDFMLGLPWSQEKKRDIISELEEILSYQPNHISLYILTAKGSYPYKGELPEDDYLEDEYLKVAEFLKDNGFLHYEVSNFAKEGAESIHNLRYWLSESVGALGPSAVGLLSEKKLRYKWKTSTYDFQVENLSEESSKLEKLYMAMRVNKGIFIEDHFDQNELDGLNPIFKNWCNEGLANLYDDLDKNRLVLTSRGFLILDSLLDQIFTVQAK